MTFFVFVSLLVIVFFLTAIDESYRRASSTPALTVTFLKENNIVNTIPFTNEEQINSNPYPCDETASQTTTNTFNYSEYFSPKYSQSLINGTIPAVVEPRLIDNLSSIEHTFRIPRFIYQTWEDSWVTGPLMQENIELWLNLNPEYYYFFFNRYDRILFIKYFFGDDVLKLYFTIDNKFAACRADVFRYLLMYALGGIYVDIDSFLRKPLRTFIKHSTDDFLTGSGRNIPYQWFLIASAQHPIFQSAIDIALTRIKKKFIKNQHAGGTLGPSLLHDAYMNIASETVTKWKDSKRMDISIRKIRENSTFMSFNGAIWYKNKFGKMNSEMYAQQGNKRWVEWNDMMREKGSNFSLYYNDKQLKREIEKYDKELDQIEHKSQVLQYILDHNLAKIPKFDPQNPIF